MKIKSGKYFQMYWIKNAKMYLMIFKKNLKQRSLYINFKYNVTLPLNKTTNVWYCWNDYDEYW